MIDIVRSEPISVSSSPGIRTAPTVAVLPDGRFLVAWMDNSAASLQPDGSPTPSNPSALQQYLANGWQISARLFSAAGDGLGNDFRVQNAAGYIPQDQMFPEVVARPDGSFLVAYETGWRQPPEDPLSIVGYDSSVVPPFKGIAGSIVTPVGGSASTVSNQFFIFAPDDTFTVLDEVVQLADGRYAAGITYYDGAWLGAQGRYTSRSEAVGAMVEGQDQAAFVDGTAETVGAITTIEDDVNVAALAGGGYVIAWRQRDGGPFTFDVFARVVGAPGGDSPVIDVAVASGNQFRTEVAALANGDFVVTWLDVPSNSTRGRGVDPTGSALTAELVLGGPGRDYEAIGLADGGFALAWVASDAFVGPIFLATFGYDGSPVVAPTQVGVGDHPKIAQLPDGDIVLVTRGSDIAYSILSGIASNLAPTSIALTPAGAAVAENAADGTLVGTLSVIDPDSAAPPTYAIVGDTGRFRIAGANLYLNGSAVLDYETAPLESLTVRATDTSGNSIDRIVSFAVANVDDAPTGVAFLATGGNALVMPENPRNGDVIGLLKAVDQDLLDVNTLTLVDDGGGAFALMAGGQLVVTDRLRYDAEAGALSGAETSTHNGIVSGPFTFAVFLQDVDPETVDGDARDNVIYGGNGGDTLRGLDGNDALFGERRFSFAPGGADTLAGGNGDDFLFGGGGNDLLSGDAGDDVLEGGDGRDRQLGGAGDDTFIFAYTALPTGELVDGGTGRDTLFVTGTVDFRAATLRNVEAVQMNVAGDAEADFTQSQITTIDSFVGRTAAPAAASARFAGGHYTVAVTMRSAGTLDLSGKTFIDIDEVRLVGSGRDDTLIGTALADDLDGRAGADTMIGGDGDDTYLVANAGDTVIEAGGGGIDTVNAAINHTLAANVENLVLVGSRLLTGIGNDLDNRITGNAKANTLDGGLGADTLVGGAGRDSFVFDTVLGPANIDTVADFSAVDDRFVLDHGVFAGLAVGKLATAAFRIGTVADADDRILYDSLAGTLWFDPDGAGGSAAVAFASVGAGLALKASNFSIA